MNVSRSALVPFGTAAMYALVEDIERYPDFLPWCSATEVSHRDGSSTRATIHVSYRGIRQSFSTDNRKQPGEGMTMSLVDGPFRTFRGAWRFVELDAAACRVEFELHYEFSSPLLAKLIGPVFSHIAGTMVDAFLRRAEQLYGGK